MTRNNIRVAVEQGDAPLDLPIGPGEDVSPEAEQHAEPDTAPVWVTYRGHADVLALEGYTLRPGVPVPMPKDVAEGLFTTHPVEEFAVSSEAPPPPAPVEE